MGNTKQISLTIDLVQLGKIRKIARDEHNSVSGIIKFSLDRELERRGI